MEWNGYHPQVQLLYYNPYSRFMNKAEGLSPAFKHTVMKFKYVLSLCFSFFLITTYAQNRPGFMYSYPSHTYTWGINCKPLSNHHSIAYNYLSNNILSAGYFYLDSDQQCLSILDSTLSQIDTTIILNTDTSVSYIYTFASLCTIKDTAYFIFEAHPRGVDSITYFNPVNLVFFKMDEDYRLSPAKSLLPQDVSGIILSAGISLKRNPELDCLEYMYATVDTSDNKRYREVALIRMSYNGDLLYHKQWEYTAAPLEDPSITDFMRTDNGKYIVTQRTLSDIYFIADTSSNEVDSSAYKPNIRRLSTIRETKDSYILMGMSDGHPILSFTEGKMQYCFLELDKNTLQEKSRYVYKLKDTLKYDIDSYIFRNGFEIINNNDYLFTTYEVYYIKPTSNAIFFCSIYCMDSLANLNWQYRIADTTYGEAFSAASLSAVPGSDDILWHNVNYAAGGPSDPGKVWVMKFKPDGSTFGLGVEEGPQLAQKFNLYPNPASDKFATLLPFIPSAEVEVQILSLKGEVLQRETYNQRDNLLEVQTSLPAGPYLVEVNTKGYHKTQKLVIRK